MNYFKQINAPAVEAYFYRKGQWVDELNAVKESLSEDFSQKSSNFSNRAPSFSFADFAKTGQAMFCYGTVFGLFLGVLICIPSLFLIMGLIAGIHILIRSLFAFSLLVGELLFLRINGLFKLCPHCHERFVLPVYECPGCGAKHQLLLSGTRYGILFRKCTTRGCEKLIPVTRITGKKKLPSFCRKCGNPLEKIDYKPITLAFMGGPSVGKTMLFYSTVANLLQEIATNKHYTAEVSKDDENKLNRIKGLIAGGVFPNSTQNTSIDAFCIDFKKNGDLFPYRLYLYDPPGESFRSLNDLSVHRYYNHLKAIIWVLDPFTLDSIRAKFPTSLLDSVKVGALSPEMCLERWLVGLEKNFNGIFKDLVCAVAINKTDVPQFIARTGLVVGDGDEKCRFFLDNNGGSNFIRILDDKFSKVCFFAVSATDGSSNGQTYSSRGMDLLLEWVWNQILR